MNASESNNSTFNFRRAQLARTESLLAPVNMRPCVFSDVGEQGYALPLVQRDIIQLGIIDPCWTRGVHILVRPTSLKTTRADIYWS